MKFAFRSRRHLVFAALGLVLGAAAPARAVIVYEDPGRLTTLPELPGGVKPGWQFIGDTDGFGGVPIGPRAWVTATHVTNTSSRTFYYANGGTTPTLQYFGTRAAVNGDLAVMVLDAGQPDFQVWAPVWSGTSNIAVGQQVYMYGYGTLRGSAITNNVPTPNTPKGWNWGAFDFALSYGTNQLSSLATVVGNTQFRMTFTQPTGLNGLPGTEGIFSTGDSGSGLFSFNNATSRWELIGINSTVERVSATSGGPLLAAALYDARGFYNGTTEITGASNVPLSSYSVALPYYESFLAPYMVVPEPGALALAGMGMAILGWRMIRRKNVLPQSPEVAG